MLSDVAIIGGTGIGEILVAMPGKVVHVPTTVGPLVGRLIQHAGGPILLVSRHSGGHKVPPHRVNYEAIALGLKKAGVKYCFGTAAVGSLRVDWPTGTMVAVSDFVDLTGRGLTLFGANVTHTDFTFPFSTVGKNAMLEAAKDLGVLMQPTGVYICENGPRYETPHEINLLTHLGDVVGMTAASEAILLHEAGIGYACLALVTNLAAGLEGALLNHEEVVDEMKKNGQTVVKLLLNATDRVRSQK